jgi:hypothetical protein
MNAFYFKQTLDECSNRFPEDLKWLEDSLVSQSLESEFSGLE